MSKDDESAWEPCQSVLCLGVLWHSVSGAIQISERRVAKIVLKVCSIIECEFVTAAKCVTSFTGQINSTSPVVENASRMMTQHCSSTCASYWDAFL